VKIAHASSSVWPLRGGVIHILRMGPLEPPTTPQHNALSQLLSDVLLASGPNFLSVSNKSDRTARRVSSVLDLISMVMSKSLKHGKLWQSMTCEAAEPSRRIRLTATSLLFKASTREFKNTFGMMVCLASFGHSGLGVRSTFINRAVCSKPSEWIFVSGDGAATVGEEDGSEVIVAQSESPEVGWISGGGTDSNEQETVDEEVEEATASSLLLLIDDRRGGVGET